MRGRCTQSEGGNPAFAAWPLQFPGWWSSCGRNVCDAGALRNESDGACLHRAPLPQPITGY